MATKTEINQAENERDDGGQGGARERGIERKQRLSDQFFELGRAIRDLDWIEMGFVIDRYTFVTSTTYTTTVQKRTLVRTYRHA